MLPAPSTAETERARRSASLVVLPAPEDVLDRFRVEVTRQQVAEWLPKQPELLLDLSPSCPRLLDLMIERGHTVVHAVPQPERLGALPERPGRLHRLRADGRSLDWIAAGSVDGVVAEGACLSTAPAAELTLEHIYRVLQPGGRLLLSVDSLVAGLSRHLDVPVLGRVRIRDHAIEPGHGATNSAQRVAAVSRRFELEVEDVSGRRVLLLDDLVVSGWSMTLAAHWLRAAGAAAVLPLALGSET